MQNPLNKRIFTLRRAIPTPDIVEGVTPQYVRALEEELEALEKVGFRLTEGQNYVDYNPDPTTYEGSRWKTAMDQLQQRDPLEKIIAESEGKGYKPLEFDTRYEAAEGFLDQFIGKLKQKVTIAGREVPIWALVGAGLGTGALTAAGIAALSRGLQPETESESPSVAPYTPEQY